MPHTQESSDGVLKTGVSLLISKHLIDFGTDKERNTKQANLIFTVASYDQNEHIQNIKELTSIFNNKDLIEALKKANSAQDIIDADKQYNT
jgi:ascorbate PTS system EIIA or EIIAB component